MSQGAGGGGGRACGSALGRAAKRGPSGGAWRGHESRAACGGHGSDGELLGGWSHGGPNLRRKPVVCTAACP